jgi:hypothetical protein
MGLLINNAKFKNTTIATPQVYARLQYVAMLDGKTTNVQLIVSDSKANALKNKRIVTDLPEQLLIVLSEEQNQDLATIHDAVKIEIEAKGFEVVIDLA